MNNVSTDTIIIDQPYSVLIWGSHPDDGNDDCWFGADFSTNEEACAAFMLTVHGAKGSILEGAFAYHANWAFVQLDGPDIHLVAPNPQYNAKRARQEEADSTLEWHRETRMQAGMSFGCDGYNESCGY